jgi:hypothetical protein
MSRPEVSQTGKRGRRAWDTGGPSRREFLETGEIAAHTTVRVKVHLTTAKDTTPLTTTTTTTTTGGMSKWPSV